MQIEKLSVSEPGQQTPFARVEELRVGLGWWPLLFGNREVRSVALYGPSANISRDQEGRLSIADLFQRHSQSSFSIKLDTLKIREGTLVLSDQMTRTDSRVASISLDADNLLGAPASAPGPFWNRVRARCAWRSTPRCPSRTTRSAWKNWTRWR